MRAARPARVLHVVGGLGIGGGEKLTALVATGLDPARFDVTVLNLGPPGVHSDFIRARGVDVVDIGLPQRARARDLPKVALGIGRAWRVLLGRPRWDIVHTHMFRTSILCAIPARFAGSRLFGTVHRVYYRWQPPVERILAPLHEAIVVDSAAVGRILQAETRIRSERYAVIHNGIATDDLDGAPSRDVARAALELPIEGVIVAEIAHLEPHKGQQHLVAAFATAAGPSDTLLLVGSGSMRQSLAKAAERLGIGRRVVFREARTDLPVILAAADVVALPSTYEGFGIVQAEAMYMGLPVVGTDRGGATEVIVDGETGFLVPFGDVAVLSDCLRELIESPALRTRMGASGRARVLAKFLQHHMIERYVELYEGRLKKGLAGAVDVP